MRPDRSTWAAKAQGPTSMIPARALRAGVHRSGKQTEEVSIGEPIGI